MVGARAGAVAGVVGLTRWEEFSFTQHLEGAMHSFHALLLLTPFLNRKAQGRRMISAIKA